MKMDIDMKARLLFTAVLLVLATGTLIWYFLAATHFTTYQIYTKDSVSGLIVDAPIEFHGVEVGKVKSVKLLEPQLVSIVLNVEKAAPVSSATVATIISRGVAARGFTGYVYVSLEDAGTVASPLAAQPGEPYPVIPTAPAKVVTLDTAVNQVNANVQAATELMRSVLDRKSVTSLRQSIDNLQQVSKALADNSAKLDSIITAAERASRRIEPLLESSQNAVNSVQDVSRQVGPLLESGQNTARSLQSASGRLGPLLESSQGTVDTIQTQILPQMTKALADLEILSNSFGDLANTINRDPSILIRGRTPARPGPGEAK
jgi:phospholipid/cholesterol/gamma-HCH transport system substrate-binding protein